MKKLSNETLQIMDWVHEMILINKSHQNDSLKPEYDYEQNINRLLNQIEDVMIDDGIIEQLNDSWFKLD